MGNDQEWDQPATSQYQRHDDWQKEKHSDSNMQSFLGSHPSSPQDREGLLLNRPFFISFLKHLTNLFLKIYLFLLCACFSFIWFVLNYMAHLLFSSSQMHLNKLFICSAFILKPINQQRNSTTRLENFTAINKKDMIFICPFVLGCIIHRLHLCRGVRPSNECPGYCTKQSDWWDFSNAAAVGNAKIPSLPTLPGPLWPRVATSGRVLSMGQIELNCVITLNWVVWCKTVLTFNCVWIKKLYLY